MSLTQRIFAALLPRSWMAALEADSRRWMIRCPCSAERSIWEAGGIRYKGKGRPRQLWWCSRCGQWRWHSVYRREDE